jgi:hypothetical protein
MKLEDAIPKYYEAKVKELLPKVTLKDKPKWMPRFVYHWFVKHCIEIESPWDRLEPR